MEEVREAKYLSEMDLKFEVSFKFICTYDNSQNVYVKVL